MAISWLRDKPGIETRKFSSFFSVSHYYSLYVLAIGDRIEEMTRGHSASSQKAREGKEAPLAAARTFPRSSPVMRKGSHMNEMNEFLSLGKRTRIPRTDKPAGENAYQLGVLCFPPMWM